MLTKDQALHAQEFHLNGCQRTVGPRGGITEKITTVRRNGMTQTWKTRPDDWSIPVKHGFKDAFRLTHHEADRWHVSTECPLLTT